MMELVNLGSKNYVKQNKSAKSHFVQRVKAKIVDNGKTKYLAGLIWVDGL